MIIDSRMAEGGVDLAGTVASDAMVFGAENFRGRLHRPMHLAAAPRRFNKSGVLLSGQSLLIFGRQLEIGRIETVCLVRGDVEVPPTPTWKVPARVDGASVAIRHRCQSPAEHGERVGAAVEQERRRGHAGQVDLLADGSRAGEERAVARAGPAPTPPVTVRMPVSSLMTTLPATGVEMTVPKSRSSTRVKRQRLQHQPAGLGRGGRGDALARRAKTAALRPGPRDKF